MLPPDGTDGAELTGGADEPPGHEVSVTVTVNVGWY